MRPLVRRSLIVIGAVLVGFWLVYLIGANLILRTEAGQSWIGGLARNVEIDWQGPSTWVPGVVHLDSLYLEGGRRQRWSISLTDVDARLRLTALALRQVRVRKAHIDTFEFGLTPVENPPPPRAGATVQRDVEDGWKLVVDRAVIERLRRLQAGQFALEGEGRIEAAMEFWFRGAIGFQHVDLSMPGSRLLREGEESIASFDTLEIRGELPRFPIRKPKIDDILGDATLAARVESDTEGLTWLEPYLRKAPWLSFERGGGRLDLDLALVKGELEPGSTLDYSGDGLAVRLLDYLVEGRPVLRGEVPEGGMPTLTIEISDYQLSQAEEGEPYILGPLIELRTLASDRRLFPPPDHAIHFELVDGQVPDVTVYNQFLGAQGAIALESGTATVNTRLAVDTAGASSEGSHFELKGEDLGLRFQGLEVRGDLRVVTDLTSVDAEQRRFGLTRSAVELSDAGLSHGGKIVSESWNGEIALEGGSVSLARPLDIETRLTLALTDARPIWAFFADGKPLVSLASSLLKMKGLEGSAELELDGDRLWVHDIDVQAKGLRLEGAMCMSKQSPAGAIWAKVHGIDGTAWVDAEGKRHWAMLHDRRKYEAQIVEVTCPEP